MSGPGGYSELSKTLAAITKQLRSIQASLGRVEERLGAMEQTSGQRTLAPTENPLIFSRVLMGTVDTIKEYEKKHGQGVVARDLARIRGVELPTIYDHLSKLEEADLVFWQRGTELGLKPHNAKFYSVRIRDERLEDLPVLMGLPEQVIPIAQAILQGDDKGVSRESLLQTAASLVQRREKPWSGVNPRGIESTLDEVIRYLLRRVLIRQERALDTDYYFPRAE